MGIKKIKITNFKSFKDLDIELGKFNVLIGANASGKSNFIQIFKFLRDIARDGLDNAISMQGGAEYLRNINIGLDANFSFEVVYEQGYGRRVVAKKKEIEPIGMRIYETIYKVTMQFRQKGAGFEIIEDKLTQKANFFRLKEQEGKTKEKEKLGEGEIIFSNVNGKVDVDLKHIEGVEIEKDAIFPPFFREEKLKPKTLLLEILETPPFFRLPPLFRNIAIYDFDPKLPKMGARMAGKAELEEDGNNLAIVLKNIIEDNDKERMLSNLVRDLLPFVEKLDVEKFADKSLLFKLKERFFKDDYVPASFISDGTINIIALVIALYFERKLLTIIEEPERNIHPYLISKVVSMMKEASQKKQIIVTTHNPEMIKHVELKDILLISRNKDGFSTISRPIEKEEIRTFLENELGIEDLYVQNLLEV